MPEKIRRVRRKRRSRSLPGVESFPSFRLHLPPVRVALYVAAAAVAVLLIALFGTYSSKLYTGWRESRLLKRATAMLEKKDFVGANRLARQVLERRRDSLPAFYILAEATEKQNSEDTVSWRAQIARLQADNIDSQLNLASAALRFGQIDLARKTLEHVAPRAQDLAAFHVVAGWLARAEGNLAEQEQQFAIAVNKDPQNDLYKFNLAALQIRSQEPGKSSQARDSLEHLTQVPEFRTGALRALLNDAVDHNDLQAADRFAQQLQMSPEVSFGDYLLCLNFYRKLDAEKFDVLLEKVKPVASRNSGDLGLLMDWMNENGLASEVVKWMDKLPEATTAKPPAAIAIAAAFAEQKNWSRLRRWTRSGSWGDEDYLRLAYQGFAWRQSRQSSADAEFDTLWRAALRAAADQPDREIKLARLASKWNLPIESEELWSRLSRTPPSRREALDALYRLYRGNKDVKKLYDVLQRLHDASPNEIGITTNLARLGLNIDQNTKQAQELAKQAYDLAPDDVNCAVTYAFSLYAQGRTTEGLEILQKLPPESLHESHTAVYAAVLLLDANQTDGAKEYIQVAKRGPIYAEEKRLLEDELTKISGASPSPTPTPSPAPTPAPSATSTSPSATPIPELSAGATP
ncbi:MAG TPA: tetratricopeptide repeat protein [Chthoniobacterales bacterium]|nr:tetratricopeptide repeat protein [Chthoniobacterales bacterium]